MRIYLAWDHGGEDASKDSLKEQLTACCCLGDGFPHERGADTAIELFPEGSRNIHGASGQRVRDASYPDIITAAQTCERVHEGKSRPESRAVVRRLTQKSSRPSTNPKHHHDFLSKFNS